MPRENSLSVALLLNYLDEFILQQTNFIKLYHLWIDHAGSLIAFKRATQKNADMTTFARNK